MSGARLFVFSFCVVLLAAEAPPKAAEQGSVSAKTTTSESTFSPQNTAPPAAPDPTGRLAQASKAAPLGAAQSKTPDAAKSPSILQMLEGHETELMIGAAIAATFFIIGWICGGNYYLRRDRLQRRKIRF